MRNSRLKGWLTILSLVSVVGACASLPDVGINQSAAAKANPTVVAHKGPVQGRQSAELLARRWARATPDMKALAVLEEAATGVPLIAGNKVTLLFDGPATMK